MSCPEVDIVSEFEITINSPGFHLLLNVLRSSQAFGHRRRSQASLEQASLHSGFAPFLIQEPDQKWGAQEFAVPACRALS